MNKHISRLFIKHITIINFRELGMQSESYKVVTIQKLQSKEIYVSSPFDGAKLWNEAGNKKLLTYEETCKPSKQAQFQNGFFAAFLEAYNNHGQIKITPDDVWLTIMLFFSQYVNDNAQKLRSAFVSHNGKQKLVVTTFNETSENQWDEFFTLMIQEIKKHTSQEVTAKLECDFSTTHRIQQILSTAVLMNTYKQYFDYERCIPMCGIQKVHFGGTLKDWKSLKAKTEQLSIYDMDGRLKTYVRNVVKILQEFIETYQDKPNIDFWNKVVDRIVGPLGSGCTHFYTGWIIDFFGLEEKVQEVKINSLDLEIQIDNKMTGVHKTVKMVGGIRAVSQEGPIYRPHLSMAILENKDKWWKFKFPSLW